MAAPVRLAYGPAPEQFAQYWPATAGVTARPLLMLVHGGYWRERYDLTHMEPMAGALARAGWPVLNVEYRRAPGRAQAAVDDLQAALSVLPARLASTPPGIVAVGFSAGGQLVLWLAARRAPLAAVVALAPVADLQRARTLHLSHDAVDEWLGGPDEPLASWDPCQMPPPTLPVTLLHGDADTDVPVELSRRYVMRHPQARLECLPGFDHFALIDPASAAWAAVYSAIGHATGATPWHRQEPS